MLHDKVNELIGYDARLRMVVQDRQKLAAVLAEALAEGPADHPTLRAAGVGLLLLGDAEGAVSHLHRALAAAGTPGQVVAARVNLADAYRHAGDPVSAEALCRAALELARREAPETVSFPLQHLGKTLAEQGRLAEAREALREALDLRVAQGDPELVAGTRAALEAIERPDFPLPLPPSVAALLGDTEWEYDHEGQSGSLARAGAHYVRRGPRAVAEFERLTWLRSRASVPAVAAYEDGVLVTADTGVPTLTDAPDAAAVMGKVLRDLHAIPVETCPFDERLDTLLERARRHVLEGLVDQDDFDDDHRDLSPREVLDRLVAERPAAEDLVVAHGDFTPSNVMRGGILIDVGGLGIADRYRDLAIAARDLRDDFGEAAVTAFFSAYGLAEPDAAKLSYYRLLDELF